MNRARPEGPTNRSGHLEDGFILGGWAAGFCLIPFYLFPSGGPQISDALFLALIAFLLLRQRFTYDKQFRPLLSSLLVFILCIALVNLSWFFVLADETFAWSTSFYLFNAAVFLLVLALYNRYGIRFIRITLNSSLFSIGLQCFLAVAGISNDAHPGRETIFFNNPNQLAYYAVAAMTSLVVLREFSSGRKTLIWAALIGGAFLSYLTVSRAALLSVALFPAIALRKKYAYVGAVTLGIAAIGVGGLVQFDVGLGEFWEKRIEKMQYASLEDFVEERRYGRIFDSPEHLVLGAGEGAHGRFDVFGLELHSSLATVLFSYGVVGFLLLLIFFWRLARVASFGWFLYLLPLILFGVFHQGLRFRIFWIVLALVAVAGAQRDRATASAQRTGAAQVPTALRPDGPFLIAEGEN